MRTDERLTERVGNREKRWLPDPRGARVGARDRPWLSDRRPVTPGIKLAAIVGAAASVLSAVGGFALIGEASAGPFVGPALVVIAVAGATTAVELAATMPWAGPWAILLCGVLAVASAVTVEVLPALLSGIVVVLAWRERDRRRAAGGRGRFPEPDPARTRDGDRGKPPRSDRGDPSSGKA